MPLHLRRLAGVEGEVVIHVEDPITQSSLIQALEARYPTLRGAIRDRETLYRRPMVRFFACQEDISNEPPDAPLPGPVASGAEPFLIVGAIAGG
jgi:sulfur-carrier protein